MGGEEGSEAKWHVCTGRNTAVFVYGPESALLGEDTEKQPGLGDDISPY